MNIFHWMLVQWTSKQCPFHMSKIFFEYRYTLRLRFWKLPYLSFLAGHLRKTVAFLVHQQLTVHALVSLPPQPPDTVRAVGTQRTLNVEKESVLDNGERAHDRQRRTSAYYTMEKQCMLDHALKSESSKWITVSYLSDTDSTEIRCDNSKTSEIRWSI